jgi:Flp pilus assembly protein TadG
MLIKIRQHDSNPSVRHSRRTRRHGAAAVEFALTAPLFFMFLFAGMEFARANTLRNLCDNAALEAARVGMVPGATAEKCIDAANESLDILSVKNATVTVDPQTIGPTTPEITIDVTIPLGDNAMPMSQFVMGTELRRSVTLKRAVPVGQQ